MKQVGMLFVVIVLLTPATFAQSGGDGSMHQTSSAGVEPSQGRVADGLPTVEDQLKLLTERLTLASEQQVKVRVILEDLDGSLHKLARSERISGEERLDRVRVQREQADKKIRLVLNDDQKRKLDQLEQEPHPELHGNVEAK